MRSHSDIIKYLGGIREVARELSHSSHTTVQGWSDRDNIPMDHWGDIIALGARLSKPVSIPDLMPASLRDAPGLAKAS